MAAGGDAGIDRLMDRGSLFREAEEESCVFTVIHSVLP